MGDFEQPKPQALTDAELTSALLQLRNQDNFILKSEELLAAQTALRAQDESALMEWRQGLAASAESIRGDAPSKVQVEAYSEDQDQEPVFTSQISVVRPKSRSAKSLRSAFHWIQFAGNLVLIGLLSGALLIWLGVTGSDALLAGFVGSALSVLPLLALKIRSHHPLLRAASFLGAKSSQFGAALFLILASWLFGSISRGANVVTGNNLLGPDQLPILITAIGVAVLGVALPIRILKVLVATASFAAAVWIFLGTSNAAWNLEITPLGASWIQGAVAVFLCTALVQVFAQPHVARSNTAALSSLPLTVLVIPAMVGLMVIGRPTNLDISAIGLSAAVFLSLSATGRDIARASVARLLSLVFLIPVLGFELLYDYRAVAIAGLTYFLIIAFLDQVMRTTSLHLPSLEVGYGFYGSFQITSWLGMAIALTISAWFEVADIGTGFADTPLQMGFLVGFMTAVLFALLRIPVVLRQNREIKLVQIHNTGAKNLLGL